jgi:ribosomal protein S18 acetylase RimI-like enzyme
MYFLRQLSAADRPAFRELRRVALSTNPEDFMMTAKEEAAVPRLSIEAALEQPSPGNLFVGAFPREDAKLIGIAGLLRGSFHKTQHCGRLTSLYVQPDHRERGVARTMMEHLLIQAAEAGLRSVRLEVVASNLPAIALYERLGFVSYGCEPAAYRMDGRDWDLLLMTRDCANS